MGITKKQRDVLSFIEEYQKKNRGVSPSFEEIKRHFNLSAVSTVYGHIQRLIRAGYLEKSKNSKREIILKNRGRIPLLGVVSAGKPIEVLEDKEYIELPEFLKLPTECFVLKVRGNSMVDEGIMDGDYIFLIKNKKPENGDLVVALLNGEVTLKKYYKEGKKIKLQPANPSYSPIYVEEKDINIQGILYAVIRKYL